MRARRLFSFRPADTPFIVIFDTRQTRIIMFCYLNIRTTDPLIFLTGAKTSTGISVPGWLTQLNRWKTIDQLGIDGRVNS